MHRLKWICNNKTYKKEFGPEASNMCVQILMASTKVISQQSWKRVTCCFAIFCLCYIYQLNDQAVKKLEKSHHLLRRWYLDDYPYNNNDTTVRNPSNFSITIDRERLSQLLDNLPNTSSSLRSISCERLFQNNHTEINLAKNFTNHARLSFKDYMTMLDNCTKFSIDRGYITEPITKEEEEFPIAYSIVMYKHAEQFERLLRLIYRPQNVYCIHVDRSASRDLKAQVSAIANCFPNVFIPGRLANVRWGQFSVLEAELICLRSLWEYKRWKYFINLTGQELPLKTNLELVKILSALKGASLSDGSAKKTRKAEKRFSRAGPIPHGIKPVKGPVHAALSRDFIDFLLHDNRSIDFIQWLRKTWVPDETLFPTLNHNPQLGIPGTFTGDVEIYGKKPVIIRFKNRQERPCGGKRVRGVCIVGVSDLHRLAGDISLFVNKLYLDYQPVTYECLEQYIFTQTKQQYLREKYIDVGFYENLDQVKKRLIIN